MGAVKEHARRIGFPIIAARVPSGSAAQCFNFRFPYVCPIWPHPPNGVHLAREAGWPESSLFRMHTNHNAFVDNLHFPYSTAPFSSGPSRAPFFVFAADNR